VSRKIVWCEVAEGKVIRIFRSQKLAFANCEPVTRFKDEAVAEIRRQVYDRQSGACLWCPRELPYSGSVWERFHMHEKIPKGRGGEVSLENSIGLCPTCHLEVAHGNRRPRFGEKD
jgi:5-methylcytosine-specific restriction endonuclease McrA